MFRTTEDPERLATFRNVLSSINWDSKNDVGSLTEVFDALDSLAAAEVRYYLRRRNTTAAWSTALRFGSWVFGTAGILFPLLPAANPLVTTGFGQWGYVCLAAAGAFVAANSLFGATAGHARFASTQLLLEKIMTQSRINWSEFRSNVQHGTISDPKAAGFGLIHAYAEALYSSILAETGNWSEAVVSELDKHANAVLGQGKADRLPSPRRRKAAP